MHVYILCGMLFCVETELRLRRLVPQSTISSYLYEDTLVLDLKVLACHTSAMALTSVSALSLFKPSPDHLFPSPSLSILVAIFLIHS